MENKEKKELVEELKSSGKTRELKGKAAELERCRDATVGWELAIKELRKEIEKIENRLK